MNTDKHGKSKRFVLFMDFFSKVGQRARAMWDALRRKFAPAPRVDFGDVYAYGKMADAAYLEEAHLRKACWDEFDEVDVRFVKEKHIQYFLASQHKRKRHLISIQGTTHMRNALIGLSFLREKARDLGVFLHKGFLQAGRALFEDVVPRLKRDYEICLTGHSMGGAEAVVLGMLFYSKGWRLSQVVTFGQPKVTDGHGAAQFGHLPVMRVVNENDIVPLLPPMRFFPYVMPYKHFGRELILREGPFYSCLEKSGLEKNWLRSFWRRLKYKYILSGEMKEHLMESYLEQVKSKMEKAIGVEEV